MHWSGGKDSAYALARVLEATPDRVAGLVTSMSEEFRRVSMHGVREDLLDVQAERLGLPMHKLLIPKDASMAAYGEMMKLEMGRLREQGAEVCIFGDIFLEDLKAYREKEMEACQLRCEFPIWKAADTQTLAMQIIESGVKAKVVCVNGKYFDRSFLGRDYNISFLNDLPEGVDPCGENGEFHTFVYDSPLYHSPIAVRNGAVIDRSYIPGEGDDDCDCCKSWDTEFYFQDLQLA